MFKGLLSRSPNFLKLDKSFYLSKIMIVGVKSRSVVGKKPPGIPEAFCFLKPL